MNVALHRITDQAGKGRKATILLELVIALGIFFTTAAVVFSGLSASFSAVKRITAGAHAAELAVTKLSEIMIGELDLVESGPNEYDEEDNLPGWTWELVVTPTEGDVLEELPVQVEVVIRRDEPFCVYRLVQMVWSEGLDDDADVMEGRL